MGQNVYEIFYEFVEMSDDDVLNAYEIYYVANMDDGMYLMFWGRFSVVKYADISSGGVGMKFLIMFSGNYDTSLSPPIISFPNKIVIITLGVFLVMYPGCRTEPVPRVI